MKYSREESKEIWNQSMSNEPNEFHRQEVRPKVTQSLTTNDGDYILDIAYGNGNYSAYLTPSYLRKSKNCMLVRIVQHRSIGIIKIDRTDAATDLIKFSLQPINCFSTRVNYQSVEQPFPSWYADCTE